MKLGSILYTIVLGLNGVFALLLGVYGLADFAAVLDGFGIPYDDGLAPLGVTLGWQFLMQGALLLVGALWTVQRHPHGPWVGYLVGGHLLGIIVFMQSTEALVIDLPRAVLLIGLGIVAARDLRSAS